MGRPVKTIAVLEHRCENIISQRFITGPSTRLPCGRTQAEMKRTNNHKRLGQMQWSANAKKFHNWGVTNGMTKHPNKNRFKHRNLTLRVSASMSLLVWLKHCSANSIWFVDFPERSCEYKYTPIPWSSSRNLVTSLYPEGRVQGRKAT